MCLPHRLQVTLAFFMLNNSMSSVAFLHGFFPTAATPLEAPSPPPLDVLKEGEHCGHFLGYCRSDSSKVSFIPKAHKPIMKLACLLLKGRKRLIFVEHHLTLNALLPPSSWSSHQPSDIGIIKVKRSQPIKARARLQFQVCLAPKPCGCYHTRLPPTVFTVNFYSNTTSRHH